MRISKRSIISSVIITLLVGMFSGCSASNGLEGQPAITDTKEVETQENNQNSTTNNDDKPSSNSKDTSASNTMDSWLGNYSFSEIATPNQNMFYEISIGKEDNKYYAELNINGYQTMSRLKADVSGNENAIKIVFEKYLTGNILEPYEKGDILLNLEKKDSELYTIWGKVEPILESNLEPGVYFEEVVNDEEWGFGMEDIAIDGNILTNLSYEDVIKIYGNPIKIETYKIPLLSAGENVYRYFSVVVYEKIEFEFYSEDAPMNDDIPSDNNVFRFDLTQTGLPLDCGLEVGMTVEEVVEMFGQRKVYNIREEESIKYALENNKPDGYYSEYSQAMTILCDTEKFEQTPLGMSLVLLVKDDRVVRIVFSYPTLD